MISTSQAIDKTGLTKSTFHRLVKEKNIPTVRHGNKMYFEEEILEQFFPSKSKGFATIICFANQKGGIGKTTTCLNLGLAFKKMGKKVLMIDLLKITKLFDHIFYSVRYGVISMQWILILNTGGQLILGNLES